jgi:hypothetical protein
MYSIQIILFLLLPSLVVLCVVLDYLLGVIVMFNPHSSRRLTG